MHAMEGRDIQTQFRQSFFPVTQAIYLKAPVLPSTLPMHLFWILIIWRNGQIPARHLIWPNSWQDALATWLAADQAERLLQDFRVPRAVFSKTEGKQHMQHQKTCEDLVKKTCTLADQNVVAADGYSARRLGDPNFPWLRCSTRMAQEGCLSRSWWKWCPCQAESSFQCLLLRLSSLYYNYNAIAKYEVRNYKPWLLSSILVSSYPQSFEVSGNNFTESELEETIGLGKVWLPVYFFNRLHMMCLAS